MRSGKRILLCIAIASFNENPPQIIRNTKKKINGLHQIERHKNGSLCEETAIFITL